MVDINEYTRETTCEYKGEVYSVRDNGAVMRHAREGKKARNLDNVWTFGTKDKARGYMMISSHRVHIIVAKAFIRKADIEQMLAGNSYHRVLPTPKPKKAKSSSSLSSKEKVTKGNGIT